MKGEREPTHDAWGRTLMNTREQLIEALLRAQQSDSDPRRPVYADAPGPASMHTARAHAYVLELYDQVRPHAASITGLWDERHLADVQLPDKRDSGSTHTVRFGNSYGPRSSAGRSHELSWRPVKVVGLSALDNWRYRTAPRVQGAPGRTSATSGYEEARVWMPPTLMSGARAALDEALNELGWLPGESESGFSPGSGDGV